MAPLVLCLSIFNSLCGARFSLNFRDYEEENIKDFLDRFVNIKFFTDFDLDVPKSPHAKSIFQYFAGNNLRERFDFDYWGLGNANALRFILEHDKRKKISVRTISFTPLEESQKMLTPAERSRLIFQETSTTTNYVIDNFRQTNSNIEKNLAKSYIKFMDFKVGNEIYLSIFKKTEN